MSQNPSSSSKRKAKVLNQDEYDERLEKIIERDFFPDYEQLKDQKDYFDATKAQDFEKMREIALKYSSKKNRKNFRLNSAKSGVSNSSPATFETPQGTKNFKRRDDDEMSVLSEASVKSKRDEGVSLGHFFAKYSNDEREKFVAIIEKSALDKKKKNAWMYEVEEKQNEKLALEAAAAADKQERLAITDGSSSSSAKKSDDGDEEEATTTSSTSSAVEIVKDNHEYRSLEFWPYKSINNVFNYPEGIEPDIGDDLFKKPTVLHANTRFASDPFKNSAHRLKMARAVKDNQLLAGESVGYDGKSILPDETPKVNNYSFVPASPSPVPGITDSPMMTWGEISSTPAGIHEAAATPSGAPRTPGFRIAEESRRDRMAHKMVDDQMKKKKAKKDKALAHMKSTLGTPRYRTLASSERISSLSPAAQILSKRFSISRDKALKASYTPSPSRRKRTPLLPTPTKSSVSRVTPSPQTSSSTTPSKAGITDNLLKLPGGGGGKIRSLRDKNRGKAEDFF